MGGLVRNTEHYNKIYDNFKTGKKGFDINRYDGDAIFKSKADYQVKYDARQFKQSLLRMVARIRAEGEAPEAPGQTTNAEAATPVPAPVPGPTKPPATAKVAPAPKMSTPTPKTATPTAKMSNAKPSTPSFAGIPGYDFQELAGNDEYMLSLPHHLFGWKDTMENDRLTLMVYFPMGVSKADVLPRIVAGGTQVEIEMIWPSIMTDPRLPMYAGTNGRVAMYGVGHVKVVSFRESVKRIKAGDESKSTYSMFRVDLPREVEEQFCDVDVPAALATVKYKVFSKKNPSAPPQDAICLVCEMIGHRSNYKDMFEIEDFAIDFENLAI